MRLRRKKDMIFRKMILAAVLLSLLLPLCACQNIRALLDSRNEQEDSSGNTRQGYSIYYINEEETKLTPVSYRLESTTADGIVEEMMGILADVPEQKGLKPIIAPPVSLLRYEYDKDNKLISLFLDENFDSLPDTTQILITAALVKSLSQFSGILDYVSICIGDRWMADADGNPLLMKNEDYVVALSGSNKMLVEATVNLYYASSDGTMLKSMSLPLKFDAGSTPASAALDALIRGPVTGDYLPVLSPNTHVNTIYIKNGLCQVDFNRGFLEKVGEQDFSLNVYSVVNTLADLDEINQVSITIDGAKVSEAPDGINLEEPFWPSGTYVEEPAETGGSGSVETETDTAETAEPEAVKRSAPAETQAPETKAKETAAPNTKASETKAPETNNKETAVPETKAGSDKH